MVSVVITTYNGEKYIIDELESICNQTVKPDYVLISDDCSKDNTVALVKQFIENNKLANWHVNASQKNIGWKQNFISALENVEGDYIFIADQDDIWHPKKIEYMLECMRGDNRIKLLACAYEKFFDDAVPEFLSVKKKSPKQLPLSSDLFNTTSPGCTYCVTKDILNRALAYKKENYPHDALIWRMSALESGRYFLPIKLHFWRKHKDSAYTVESHIMKSKKSKIEWTYYAEDFLNDMLRYCSSNNLENKKNIKLIEKNLKWNFLRRRFLETRNPLFAIRLLRYLGCYARFKQYLFDWYLVLKNRK